MDLHISELLRVFKPRPVEVISRGKWLNRFYYELSKTWNGKDPLSRLRVGIAMKRFNTEALPSLWAVCSDSKDFSKMFWWKVKQMPVPPRKKVKKNLHLF